MKLGLLIAVAAIAASAQPASKDAMNFSVRIHADKEVGSGFVIGQDKSGDLYVATASHVVRRCSQVNQEQCVPQGDPFVLANSIGALYQGEEDQSAESNQTNKEPEPRHACSVVMTRQLPDDPDVAVLKCKRPDHYKISRDIVGNPDELKDRARVIMISGMGKEIMALGDIFYQAPSKIGSKNSKSSPSARKPITKEIEAADVFQRPLEGTSGGPVLTERSELIGIEYKQVLKTGVIQSYSWPYVKAWIDERDASIIKLRPRSRSAPALRSGTVEVSAGVSSLYVPKYGWLPTAPNLRVATPLPNAPLFDLAFDFTFSQTTKQLGGGTEALSVTIPAITGEFALGAAMPGLRRKQWLGGVYVSSGVAPIFLNDTLRSYNTQAANIHAWSPVFDAGWRYRMPGRQWGFAASYREALLLGTEAQNLYPRLRSATGGLFILFR